MQWFYDNYKWLFDGIGAIIFIGVITFLWRRLGSTPAAQVPAPDSHSSNSAVASGNVTNIYNVQPHAPAVSVTPVALAPDIGAVPGSGPGAVPRVKPRPNMKMTGAKVIRINEYDPGRLVEDRTGRRTPSSSCLPTSRERVSRTWEGTSRRLSSTKKTTQRF